MRRSALGSGQPGAQDKSGKEQRTAASKGMSQETATGNLKRSSTGMESSEVREGRVRQARATLGARGDGLPAGFCERSRECDFWAASRC